METLTPDGTSTAVWTAAIAVIIATERIPGTSTTIKKNQEQQDRQKHKRRLEHQGTSTTAGMLPIVVTPETAGTTTTAEITTGSKECQ